MSPREASILFQSQQRKAGWTYFTQITSAASLGPQIRFPRRLTLVLDAIAMNFNLQFHLRQRFFMPTGGSIRILKHDYGEELRFDCATVADAEWSANYLYERLMRAAQLMQVQWVGISSKERLCHRFLAQPAESSNS